MSSNYVTTNVRLPKEMLKALRLKAAREDKSIAQLIREAIQTTFFREKATKLSEAEFKEELFKIVGLGESGIRDGSIHHDDYIYGGKD